MLSEVVVVEEKVEARRQLCPGQMLVQNTVVYWVQWCSGDSGVQERDLSRRESALGTVASCRQ